jgi:hypothetical protein
MRKLYVDRIGWNEHLISQPSAQRPTVAKNDRLSVTNACDKSQCLWNFSRRPQCMALKPFLFCACSNFR